LAGGWLVVCGWRGHAAVRQPKANSHQPTAIPYLGSRTPPGSRIGIRLLIITEAGRGL
jgi:hypothetical protein